VSISPSSLFVFNSIIHSFLKFRKSHITALIWYIIVENETGEVVGRCAFPPRHTDWRIPQFSISYFIRKIKRSKGYATETMHAMALLAFQALQAKKVEIYCDAENTPSINIPY